MFPHGFYWIIDMAQDDRRPFSSPSFHNSLLYFHSYITPNGGASSILIRWFFAVFFHDGVCYNNEN